MALYVGEAVRIRASALDPETQAPLDPPPQSATVSFWGPDRNPVKEVELRNDPDYGPFDMVAPGQTSPNGFVNDSADFIAFVSTSEPNPWEAGKWTYRVTVVGNAFENFEFGTFKLKE